MNLLLENQFLNKNAGLTELSQKKGGLKQSQQLTKKKGVEWKFCTKQNKNEGLDWIRDVKRISINQQRTAEEIVIGELILIHYSSKLVRGVVMSIFWLCIAVTQKI